MLALAKNFYVIDCDFDVHRDERIEKRELTFDMDFVHDGITKFIVDRNCDVVSGDHTQGADPATLADVNICWINFQRHIESSTDFDNRCVRKDVAPKRGPATGLDFASHDWKVGMDF